jgi:hypothetical protein
MTIASLAVNTRTPQERFRPAAFPFYHFKGDDAITDLRGLA